MRFPCPVMTYVLEPRDPLPLRSAGAPENRRAVWGLQAGRSSMGSGKILGQILGKRANGGAGWSHIACVPCELPESL